MNVANLDYNGYNGNIYYEIAKCECENNRNRGCWMNNIVYKELKIEDINTKLFSKFNRYQDVKKCWRKIDGEWILKDIAFVENWSEREYEFLVKCLIDTINMGGSVYAAFKDNYLVGFASLENEKFGAENKYLQLSSIHTSYKSRGLGIGKKLFSIMIEEAKKRGAKKLYISAHSSEESRAFYEKLGCVEAEEYNKKLVKLEPCDCQLEYKII